ncbi:3'-5' exoribonuclease [Trichosporon asahii var. asahii CBS 2479]|uniref:3'-5' exoribonuclease n=1 Tax=Trichosporon asahii var. asahii (strain ATCC 90039 / CBS 2479 / JCM 2466 / KCTC 7840 / NBRC 103889/ NCYC 2677 / UAMH 7654) TaxID=1186058 RepID=J6ES31_TRIAS|nr:3'-5' exoribonuclease [Trichosporon asahii var. asahii CBS 2479]EJT45512.1 3'-5' exoribonuclease [Trichosporon asahii var. asahii CBS 2479]
MSHPPPGLGGGVARTGPPPGFGSNNAAAASGGASGAGAGAGGANGTAAIVRAQIVFLLTTFTEDSFDKAAAEIRTLASSNGPEMYHHFVRRTAVVASPVIQALVQHQQQYKDDPAAPPPQIPTSGPAALAWRLLATEAVRAARDVALAPHFVLTMLSPSQGTPLPLPSLRLFNLPPAVMFSLSALTLANPHVYPTTHPSHEQILQTLHQTFQPTMELLRAGVPFWSTNIPNQPQDDLTMQEARTLILALYPRSTSATGTTSRPPTPTNPTPPHPSPLNSLQRGFLLQSLTIKFTSPAIILQTLSALSPGGAPRTQGSIPLEDILFELGDSLTQDEGTVEAAIGRWWGPYLLEEPINQQNLKEEIIRTLHGLCMGLRDGRAVDFHGVLSGICATTASASIPWVEVVKAFDMPNSPLAHPSAVPLAASLLLVPPQTPVPPIAGLLPATLNDSTWTNLSSLLYILRNLSQLPPDSLPLYTLPTSPSPQVFTRIVEPYAPDAPVSKVVRQQAKDVQSAGLWNSLGLIQVLVQACALADAEDATDRDERVDMGRRATELLDRAGGLAPELVLIALEKLPKPLPAPIATMHSKILEIYLINPPSALASAALVFQQIWELNPKGLLDTLTEFYSEDENNLGKVVEVAWELQILDKLLASDNLHFALDVAALASSKEYFNLENWLADSVAVNGEDFLQAMFDFVEHKIRLEIDHQHQPESVPPPMFTLSDEAYSIFIRVVRNADNLTREDVARFKSLRTDILILHPRLLNLRAASKEEQGFVVATYNKSVSAQVDDMYRRMYSEEHELTLDDVVEELKRYQKSSDPRDQELFGASLHSLFDEYKFIKTYPPRELTMTGILFGAIIDYRLVKDTPAFVATRYVLDACKTPPHEPPYQFGVSALSVLRASLVDFPGLCRSLLEIPALHESHPSYINDIHAALAEREELDLQGGVKLAFPALKLPILIEEGEDEFKEPEPKVRDQIMFIINNIAPSNWEAKSQELVKLMKPEYSRWFAHYFIDVRVSLEANRHDLYFQILELLSTPILEKHVLWETYRKARDLLNAESTLGSASDRATLKTVALWLGRITLQRGLPIKHRELSIKDLLVQGYDNKRLIVAIPFVCNVMLACQDSKVFHQPNPWFVAILRVLVELYHFGDIKLNMKFEIEVLFGKLGLQLDTIEASDVIRTHVPPPQPQAHGPNRLEVELQRQLITNDLSSTGAQRFGGTSTEPSIADDPFTRMQALQTEQAAQALHEQFLAHVDDLIRQLPEYLHFNSDLGVLQAPTFKRIVLHSIERAIREIVSPVVERSVTIAGISSRDLVQKDFGTECDSIKMRKAAHLMVQNLAGNLALVTCKEPLRTSLMSHIRALVGQNGFTEENVPDGVIAGVVNENLDVACDVIRKAAMEKATRDIDVNLQPQFAARKAHRDSRSQQPFWDGASFGVAISHTALPDPLRLRQGGLTATQLRVYEDFAESARVFSQQQQQAGHLNGGNDYNLPVGYRDLGLGDGGLVPPPDVRRGPSPRNADFGDQEQSFVMAPQTTVEKLHELVADIEKLLSQTNATSISQLEPDHDLRSLSRTIIVLAHSSMQREATTLAIAQKIVQLLYKTDSPLGRELYVVILQQLCLHAPKVDREVKSWLLYAEDPRKYNVPVTAVLIRGSFIRVAELDAQLAKVMTRGATPEVVDFTAQLIRECCIGPQAFINRNAFTLCITALLKAQEQDQSTSTADQLLEDLRGEGARDTKVMPIDAKVHERLQHYFFEWVRLFTDNPNSPEVSFVPYITWLQGDNILGGEDVSTAFYTTAIKAAVDCDMKSDNTQWYGTDSLAKLIVLIVKNYGDKSGPGSVQRTVYYFNKIITIMSYSLVRAQLNADEPFDQRPWARFFTSMLAELSAIEASLPETVLGCLKSIANVLGIIQPTYAPRFAFGWVSIMSHRLFMAKLLGAPRQEGWSDYHRCLMWLLRFVSPFVNSNSRDLGAPARSLYRATLRILLVLMHDFPGFLVEYYHTLSTAIPAHCVQLRNIILAAFPASEAPLPDCALNTGNVKQAIDQYIHTNSPSGAAIVNELKNRIAVQKTLPDGTTTTVWNHTLLHATVFYLGTSAVQRHYMQSGVAEFDPKDPAVPMLLSLVHSFDAEGQYLMLSVIADQLRFPSAHTLFFASLMLYLFKVSTDSSIPERIARVLLERVIVTRPHPWGLIVTFVELLENPVYGFWDQPFVRADEEIFLMFRRARENFGTQMH